MDERKIKEILDNYSAEAQTIKAIEELAELQAELSRMLIRQGNRDAMKGELADVFIMITQLMAIFDIDPAELDEIVEFKLDRQIRRIRGDDMPPAAPTAPREEAEVE